MTDVTGVVEARTGGAAGGGSDIASDLGTEEHVWNDVEISRAGFLPFGDGHRGLRGFIKHRIDECVLGNAKRCAHLGRHRTRRTGFDGKGTLFKREEVHVLRWCDDTAGAIGSDCNGGAEEGIGTAAGKLEGAAAGINYVVVTSAETSAETGSIDALASDETVSGFGEEIAAVCTCNAGEGGAVVARHVGVFADLLEAKGIAEDADRLLALLFTKPLRVDQALIGRENGGHSGADEHVALAAFGFAIHGFTDTDEHVHIAIRHLPDAALGEVLGTDLAKHIVHDGFAENETAIRDVGIVVELRGILNQILVFDAQWNSGPLIDGQWHIHPESTSGSSAIFETSCGVVIRASGRQHGNAGDGGLIEHEIHAGEVGAHHAESRDAFAESLEAEKQDLRRGKRERKAQAAGDSRPGSEHVTTDAESESGGDGTMHDCHQGGGEGDDEESEECVKFHENEC